MTFALHLPPILMPMDAFTAQLILVATMVMLVQRILAMLKKVAPMRTFILPATILFHAQTMSVLHPLTQMKEDASTPQIIAIAMMI